MADQVGHHVQGTTNAITEVNDKGGTVGQYLQCGLGGGFRVCVQAGEGTDLEISDVAVQDLQFFETKVLFPFLVQFVFYIFWNVFDLSGQFLKGFRVVFYVKVLIQVNRRDVFGQLAGENVRVVNVLISTFLTSFLDIRPHAVSRVFEYIISAQLISQRIDQHFCGLFVQKAR